jgi:hypothetical protein
VAKPAVNKQKSGEQLPIPFFVAISDQKWDVIVWGVGLQNPDFKAFALAVGAAYQLVKGNPSRCCVNALNDLVFAY